MPYVLVTGSNATQFIIVGLTDTLDNARRIGLKTHNFWKNASLSVFRCKGQKENLLLQILYQGPISVNLSISPLHVQLPAHTVSKTPFSEY
jgi:hypothetical protein